MNNCDWTPNDVNPVRRLFQVRQALELPHLPKEHRDSLQELATNLERKFEAPVKGERK